MKKQMVLLNGRLSNKVTKTVLQMMFLLSVFLLVLVGCSSEDDLEVEDNLETVLDGEDVTTETNSIKLSNNTTFGNILTDGEGMTLYFFSKDTKGDSECEDGCLAAWPAFYKENLTFEEGLEAADFDVITRADGAKQNTYKGWPLYYYVTDSSVGDTNGDGVGGNWFVAKPDYSLMYAQADINEESTFYITNATGRTIYLFNNDTKDDNNFTKEDFSNNGSWPVISLEIDEIPSVLDSSDFGTIDVFGTTQVTYKGWPLYYFGGDTERGDVKGVSNTWPIVNVDTESAPSAL